MSWYMYKGQRRIWDSWFFSFYHVGLRLSDLAAGVFTHRDILLTSPLLFPHLPQSNSIDETKVFALSCSLSLFPQVLLHINVCECMCVCVCVWSVYIPLHVCGHLQELFFPFHYVRPQVWTQVFRLSSKHLRLLNYLSLWLCFPNKCFIPHIVFALYICKLYYSITIVY